ncbi:NIPSNAP family protein [Mucilaginibacter myungsuensis]|nr:NIPSNAP family protein [Mucilaginibacter myungsuensis]
MIKSFTLNILKAFVLILLLQTGTAYAKGGQYIYQLKIYHFKTKAQADVIDEYLEKAYIPAMHRAGIVSVGVFKPITVDTLDQLIYVFTPFKKMDDLMNLETKLVKDKQYQQDGKTYLEASYKTPPYTRIEAILLKAFSKSPEYKLPKLSGPKSERFYELRSYEGHTENISANKIGMFNDAEIKIFDDLNFNAVFYGEVIAGRVMPNLMYLTTYENKADRDKHWSAFGAPYGKVSGLPQYQNNVSKNVQVYLKPTDYSDI